jgi:hypothetical protein
MRGYLTAKSQTDEAAKQPYRFGAPAIRYPVEDKLFWPARRHFHWKRYCAAAAIFSDRSQASVVIPGI